MTPPKEWDAFKVAGEEGKLRGMDAYDYASYLANGNGVVRFTRQELADNQAWYESQVRDWPEIEPEVPR